MIKVKHANRPKKLQSELKELKEIHVVDKKPQEIKNEKLVFYAGDFEMVGKLSVGDQIRETHIRFRKITDYESYINAFNQDYESEDAIVNGYIYIVSTLHFNLLNRSQYGNGCDFKHEFIQ